MALDAVRAVALLVLLSVAPPVLLVWRLRNAETRRREPWRGVRRAFLWGALLATLVSILVEPWLLRALAPTLAGLVVPVGTVVVAPLVEETAKGAGLLAVRDADPEPEDGLVYGATAGLGFAATENAVFVLTAWILSGQDVALATALFRGVAAVGVHAGATALTGYGLWRARRRGRMVLLVPVFLLLAMLLHAGYNLVAGVGTVAALLVALGLGAAAWIVVERRVRALDRA